MRFEVNGKIPRPDVLIVARGGGSLEDLWSFNEEIVVRAAAESLIPLISAVGHETDWTLIDLVADARAPTPTGAAEIAVPVKADLEATVANLLARLRGCISRSVDRRRHTLRAAGRALPTADQLLALPRRRFDDATSRLGRALTISTNESARGLARCGFRRAMLSRGLAKHEKPLFATCRARRQPFAAVCASTRPGFHAPARASDRSRSRGVKNCGGTR